MDQFKVGDKVWCLMFGEGVVVSVANDGRDYPVMVRVGCQSHTYSQSGVLLNGGKRSLFFSEPKVEAATERPFISTLIGKCVVVNSKECGLRAGIVFEKTSDEIRVGAITWDKARLNSVHEVGTESVLKL